MQNKSWQIGLILISLSITACDSIPFINNSPDYKGAGKAKPLEVPPDLTEFRPSEAYSVPGSTSYSSYQQKLENQEPGTPAVLPESKHVRMIKSGGQRWLVVKAEANSIWPIMRDFWLDQGFAVRVENPQIGLMETEWLDANAVKVKEDKRGYGEKFDAWLDGLSNIADRYKFRTRLERGEQAGTVEIYLSHRTVAGAPDDGKNIIQTQLGPIDTGYKIDADKRKKAATQYDADLDAELLRRLMVKLGLDQDKAQQVANNALTPQRAEAIKEADQSVVLKVAAPFDRTWRRVSLAIDRIGFVVEDKNREAGVFYVRYAEADATSDKDEKGFWSSLKFWGDDEDNKQSATKQDTSDTKFWKGANNQANPDKKYLIQVLENEDDSYVAIVDEKGKRNPSTPANSVIALLYEQLK